MALSNQMTQALSASGAALGVVAAVAPKPFGRAFGFSATDAEANHMGRLWGTKVAALGVLGVIATSRQDRRQYLATVAAMHLADVVLDLRATELPARARMLAASASGFFALATAAGLAAES